MLKQALYSAPKHSIRGRGYGVEFIYRYSKYYCTEVQVVAGLVGDCMEIRQEKMKNYWMKIEEILQQNTR